MSAPSSTGWIWGHRKQQGETITTTSLTPTSGPAGGAAAHLRLPDKDAVVLLAGEVAFALHRAVVLALGLVQDHAHPLPGGKKRVSDVGHRAALSLPDHLHQGAHLHRSAAAATTVGAHPTAAAAGRLRETDRQADRQVQYRVSLFPTIFGLQWSSIAPLIGKKNKKQSKAKKQPLET